MTKDMQDLKVGDKVTHVGTKAMLAPYEVIFIERRGETIRMAHLEGDRTWAYPHGPVTVAD